MPAKMAISFAPRGVCTPSLMSGANRLCIWRGVLSAVIFRSSFIVRTFVVLKIFSFRIQPVRPLSTPSVR